FDAWTLPYTPASSFNAVFGVTQETGFTLLGILQRPGGGLAALARQAVAALLNATNPDIHYGFTSADVIARVQSAYADPALVDSTAAQFEKQNQGEPDLTGGPGGGQGNSQGGEGLSHGYWKQSQHFGDWTAPYTTTSSFNAVFGITQEPGLTLLGALQRG